MPEVQATGAWVPPSGPLGTILQGTRRRIARDLEPRRRELEQLAGAADRAPSMAAALRDGPVAVIAEVKRRSPSKG